MLALDRLQSLLNTLPRLTIGLVGDLFLDRYLHVALDEMETSLETGLEAYQIDRVRNAPGALGTVMNNLAALGVGLLVPVSVIGDDGHGYDLLRELGRLPVDKGQLLCSRERLTPTYTKPLRRDAQGVWQELNRLDVRTRAPLSPEATAEVCRRLAAVFHSSDGLIVLDQIVADEQGVINSEVRATLRELAQAAPEKLIFVDSRAHLSRLESVTLKCNRSELAALAPQHSPAALRECALTLAERNQRTVFVTQGEEGVLVAQPDGTTTLTPAFVVEGPIDIVGAGDSCTSGIVAALLAGASDCEAAEVGNLVASITIEQLGETGTATPAQILARRQES
jgi:rfaE bifunctional protein kinase chain/domain